MSETLPGLLDTVAREHPGVRATFWTESETIGYGELCAEATAMASALVDRGVRRGEPVGILCPNAPEFLTALFAVLAAGGAATPLPLPSGAKQAGGYSRRLAAITEAAGMRTVLVSHRFATLAGGLGDDLGAELVATDALGGGGAPLPELAGDDLAVVQFTSGSTAQPKGVRLTHRNVLAGLAAIREGIALGRDDSGGFWLPLFHDMGLFGTLSALLLGIPVHVWSPLSFVKRPGRWLREFAESAATITAMPNFGYETLRSAVGPDEVAELDLSRWRIAFNGAEPISRETVLAFAEHLAPAGFRPSALFGVYGMAEATLAVTFPPLGRDPLFDWVDRDTLAEQGRAVPAEAAGPGARAVAGVGRPVPGMRLRIADPGTGRDLPDNVVGEILIQGPSVTTGYLTADPAQAAGLFAGEWLRTGDLGYLRGGELFVTGRRKEMITVRGANFYPQDVEAAARRAAGVYKGRCAAVSAPGGEEAMLLIAETALTGAEAEALAADLTARVTAELGLAEVAVHLVAPRAIPRTSSGKLQRLAARDLLTGATVIG